MSHSNENAPASLGDRLRHVVWVGHWGASAVIIPTVAVSYLAFLFNAFA